MKYIVYFEVNVPLLRENPEKFSFTYTGLRRLVADENPSMILANAFSIATTKIWGLSLFEGTPYIIWSGAIHDGKGEDSYLRRIQRRILVRGAAGFVAYGKKAKEYLVSLGADVGKVQIGINTVDTEFYASESGRYRRNRTSKDGKKHLLYVGHLSPRKNVLRCLEVMKFLVSTREDTVLDLVGDGDDRPRLERYVNSHHLNRFVKFHGFRQRSDVARFLGQSDCFLFQTDFDIWGLALVEAMASAVPCIASINAGATHDLIKGGITGFAMDFSETTKVAEKANWILNNPQLSKRIGRNAQRFIAANASIAKSVDGLVRAVKEVQKQYMEKT